MEVNRRNFIGGWPRKKPANKIRKKCSTCDRTQVVPIDKTACELGSFRTPPCSGILERFSRDLDDAILNLLAVARQINDLHRFKESELLNECIEDLEAWTEKNQTPQEMGWVGSDGLP